jgi:hypothetical protein
MHGHESFVISNFAKNLAIFSNFSGIKFGNFWCLSWLMRWPKALGR